MSQALHSTIIPEFCKIFKIKLRVSFCMSLSNLSIYVVFLDPLQSKVRFASLILHLMLYLEFIGMETTCPYLQSIFCKVK
jgi:hypothetical protein